MTPFAVLFQLTINEVASKTWLDLLESLLTALVGAGLALLGVYLANKHQGKIQIKKRRWQDYQEREQAYVRLHGAVILANNLINASFGNYISNMPISLAVGYASPFYLQVLSHKHTTDLESIRAMNQFHTALADVGRRYHMDQEIGRLIFGLAGFDLALPPAPHPQNLSEAQQWTAQQRAALRDILTRFSSQTGTLFTVLRERLNAEKSRLELEDQSS